jgi:hypothetical protein
MNQKNPMAHMIRIVRWEALTSAQKIDIANLQISDQQIEYAGPTHRAIETCASDLTGDIQGAAMSDLGTRDKGRIGWVRYMKRDLHALTSVAD